MGGEDASPSSNSKDGKQDVALPSSYDAKSIQGVVYKGPQVIVSNSAHPDNFIQTIRQPDLVDNPKLPAPLPIPPMVSIAAAKVAAPPAPQPTADVSHENRPVQVAPEEPIIVAQQPSRIEAPKLALPALGSANTPLRAVANAAPPASMPTLAHQNTPTKTGRDQRDILVVDALPVPGQMPAAVPPGELHGTFTVSPTGATSAGLAGGGNLSKGAPGMANATGSGASAYAGNGKVSGSNSSETPAMRANAGRTTGVGGGGPRSKEAGSGSGMGIEISGSGSGSGRGAGAGSSPFPSIMIQGGSSSSGVRTVAKMPGTASGKSDNPQRSYGMTIVANGANGGGFKDFGVFRNEASYTVYLDMADTGIYGSSWALQYALDSHVESNSVVPAPTAHGALVPPYAISKSLPHFSPDAVKKSRGGTIVVFGVINPQGKFEKLRVMHSLDPGLDKYLLDSLGVWTFRPAEMDGIKVAVKVLLGIPVNFVQ
jgi:hypothetical protein